MHSLRRRHVPQQCATANDLKPLKLSLNRAVRFIFNLSRREHITPYLQELHILPIRHRIRFKICLLGFKVLNHIAPFYICEKYTLFCPTTAINLRTGCGRDQLMFRPISERHTKDSIFDKLVIEWNSLPLSIRSCHILTLFKEKLKTFLFKDAFLK